MSGRKWTRHEALRELIRPTSPKQAAAAPSGLDPVDQPSVASVALIQGRRCLAYRSLACSICAERCPEPGAIIRERGIPRIDPDVCTGCNICHEVCPAPRNAVLILPKAPASAPMNWSRS